MNPPLLFSLTDYLSWMWNYCTRFWMFCWWSWWIWILVWKYSCRHHQSQLGMHNGHIIIIVTHDTTDDDYDYSLDFVQISRTLISPLDLLVSMICWTCGGGTVAVAVTSCVSFLPKNMRVSLAILLCPYIYMHPFLDPHHHLFFHSVHTSTMSYLSFFSPKLNPLFVFVSHTHT